MTELVGIREAARRLRARGQPIDASTISRQVRSGVIPNRGSAGRPLVDPDEVVSARAAWLDPAKQRLAAPATSNPQLDTAGAAGAPPLASAPLLHQARTAKVGYDAKRSQLEYEKAVGNLVAADEIQDAAFELGQHLRQLMATRVEGFAVNLRRLAPDVAQADFETAIMADDQQLQQKIADALIAEFGGASDNGDRNE